MRYRAPDQKPSRKRTVRQTRGAKRTCSSMSSSKTSSSSFRNSTCFELQLHGQNRIKPCGLDGGAGVAREQGFRGGMHRKREENKRPEGDTRVSTYINVTGNKMHGPHLPQQRSEVWRAACHQSPSPLRKLHRYMVQATYTHKPRSLPVVTAVCGAALILWQAPDQSPLTKF